MIFKTRLNRASGPNGPLLPSARERAEAALPLKPANAFKKGMNIFAIHLSLTSFS